MKQLFVAAICVGLSFTAAAQKVRSGVPVYHRVYAIRPAIGFGFGYYSPFYSPFGYYGLPYGAYPYGSMYNKPSKLERQEEDIRSDYADRIYSVKHDDSLTNQEKRQQIRALKKERKQQIHDLIANYHNQPRNQKGDEQLKSGQSSREQPASDESSSSQESNSVQQDSSATQ